MTDFRNFLLWEIASRDTIDFKKIYVDIAGDLNAGLLLSEIVYWYLPSKDDRSKLRVDRDGFMWIACHRYEWWERTRMTPKEADRAIKILCDKGVITKQLFKFAGDVTLHIRLIEETFLALWDNLISNPLENPFLPKVKIEIDQKVKSILTKSENPITESTSKITTENKEIPSGDGAQLLDDFFNGNTHLNEEIEKAELERQRLDKAAADERAAMLETIREVFGVGGAQATNYLVMLRGTAKKNSGKWYTYRIENGLTALELRQWVAYYKAYQVPVKDGEQFIMVKELDKLNGYIMAWLEGGKPSTTEFILTPADTQLPPTRPETKERISQADVNDLLTEIELGAKEMKL